MDESRQTPGLAWAGHFGALAVVLIVGATVYLNSLQSPFTFDDVRGIVQNPAIQQLWPPTWATDAPLGTISAGRPVVGLSLALNHAAGGLDVVGYRLLNLAVHVGCGLLLFGVIRRTIAGMEASAETPPAVHFALAVAILWLVHPLQSECINYISQRTSSLMALFYLATLYAAIRARTTPLPWSILAVLFCALGMASKAVMVSAPLMVVAHDWAFGLRTQMRRRVPLYVGLAGTWVILFALLRLFPDQTIGYQTDTTPWQYALNQCEIITGYLGHTVWPASLVFDYGYPRDRTLGAVLPQALLVVSLLALAGFTFFRWPPIGYAAVWFFVILAPTSSFVPIATEVGAERRMYLALAGPLVLAMLGLWRLVRSLPGRGQQATSLAAIAMLLALPLGAATVVRNRDYQTGLRIWETAVATRPDNARAHANYSQELLERDQLDEALSHGRRAVELAPHYPVGHYALGSALRVAGDYGGAAAHFATALKLDPRMREAELNLWQARTEDLLGRASYEAAERAARELLALLPEHPGAVLLLARSLAGQGSHAEAEALLRTALAGTPDDPFLLLELADSLLSQSRTPAARAILETLVRSYPGDSDSRVRLARVLRIEGQAQQAEEHLATVLRADASAVEAWLELARLLRSGGRQKEALARLREGLRHNADAFPLGLELAWQLATLGEDAAATRALTLANQLHQAQPGDPRVLETLATASAQTGDFEAAVRWGEAALEALADGDPRRAAAKRRLEAYRAGRVPVPGE